jgi:hypothetical protein
MRHGHRDIARAAVQHHEHGIPAIGAADRDPLVDPTDRDLLKPLHAVGGDDLARVGNDRRRLGAAGRRRWSLTAASARKYAVSFTEPPSRLQPVSIAG